MNSCPRSTKNKSIVGNPQSLYAFRVTHIGRGGGGGLDRLLHNSHAWGTHAEATVRADPIECTEAQPCKERDDEAL